MSSRSHLRPLLTAAALLGLILPMSGQDIAPKDASGRTLNLGFETGDLTDWTATGGAFHGQPVRGDVVKARRSDMESGHSGEFWIGGYEKVGDDPKGTLTSKPFRITTPEGVRSVSLATPPFGSSA